MKKLGVISLVLCLSVYFCGSFVCATTVESTEPTEQTIAAAVEENDNLGVDSAVPLLGSSQLVENVKAAFLFELTSDTLMYAYNADAQMYPSSFVKILTALIAIEEGNLNDVVVATEEVLATVPYDAVSSDIQIGEELTLEQLIYCMMVGSGNDAAAVIASHISGSQELFVQKMNEYAHELGCTGTQFMNVHGLHHEDQYTTARDMAKILRQAMKNESFVTVFSTVNYTIPATNKSAARDLVTGNFMLNTSSMEIYYDARVAGGRTGVASDRTRCLATSAAGNGLELISIVFGAEDVVEDDGYTITSYGGYKETTELLNMCLDGYKAVQVLFPNQAVTQVDVVDGENNVVLGSDKAVSAVLPADVGLEDLSFKYGKTGQLRAPIALGERISNVEVWYGATCVAKGDLYAMNSVRSVLDMQSAENAAQNEQTTNNVLSVVFWVVIVCIALVLVVRFLPTLRKILTKRRMRLYRKNRRRSR